MCVDVCVYIYIYQIFMPFKILLQKSFYSLLFLDMSSPLQCRNHSLLCKCFLQGIEIIKKRMHNSIWSLVHYDSKINFLPWEIACCFAYDYYAQTRLESMYFFNVQRYSKFQTVGTEFDSLKCYSCLTYICYSKKSRFLVLQVGFFFWNMSTFSFISA